MVSIGPYNEAMNFRHMFDKYDLRGPYPIAVPSKNSISDIINNSHQFSRFSYILKLSKLEYTYGQQEANFTLFIPTDKSIQHIPEAVFTNMDIATARNIVKASTVNRKISIDVLRDSPASYILTENLPNRLLVTNINGETYINNNNRLVGFQAHATNGIIHVVDSLLIPTIT